MINDSNVTWECNITCPSCGKTQILKNVAHYVGARKQRTVTNRIVCCNHGYILLSRFETKQIEIFEEGRYYRARITPLSQIEVIQYYGGCFYRNTFKERKFEKDFHWIDDKPLDLGD